MNEMFEIRAEEQKQALQSFAEGLTMHANEMEAETRKIQLFTDSRFKLKSD